MFTVTRPRFSSSLLQVTLLLFALLGLSPGTTAQAQDLNLSINANKSPALPGASVTYTVHVSNSGASGVTGAVVQIPLPSNAPGFDDNANNDSPNVSCPGGFCSPGETLTWSVGGLDARQSRVLIFRTVIPSSAPNSTVTKVATLSASGQPDVTESVDVIIDNAASVALDIGIEDSPVAPGQTFEVRVDYGAFEGRGGADFGELSVVLPSELQFIEASGSGTESGGTVSWMLGPVSGGFNGEETVTVQANAGLSTGTLMNVVAELDPGNSGEPVAVTKRTIPVHPTEPLRVQLSASDIPTVRNRRVDFTLTASNTSSSTIQGTSVRFLLPDFISFDDDENNVPGSVSCPGGFCSGGEFMTWTTGDLEPGQTRTLLFEAFTSDVAAGGALQRFIGYVTSPGFSEQMPTVNYGFKTEPVLAVGLDAEKAPVPAGGTFTYRITTGVLDFSSGADDATLRLELPDDVSFVSATGSPTVADGVVTWAFGPLGAGFSDEQTVTVQADNTLPDGGLLQARVEFDPGAFGESKMRGHIDTPIGPESPLKVALTTNDTPIFSGTRVDFALTVSNDSPFPVSDGVVQLVLPGFIDGFDDDANNDPANVSCSGGFCSDLEILTWQAGDLGAGEAKTLYLETGTFGPGGELLRFRGLANASRSTEQIFTPNISIDATPVMAFGLSGASRPVPRANTYTYQLNYGAYGGRGGASDATMRLLLPKGTTPVSTNGGTINDNAIEWNLGAVGGADGGRRVVEVDIDDALPEGALLVARASLASGNVGETTQHASLPLTTLDSNPLRLIVTPPEAPVQPGQQVTYEVEIENTGTANIASPNVKIVLSDFFDSFDDNPNIGAVCPGGFCGAGEILTWTPPDLTPGQTRTLSFTTNVFSSILRGDIVRLRLEASGAGASTIYQTVNTTIASDFTIPVELARFTATTSGDAVALQWETASETNNAGFDVERSTDGETFAAIGFEPGVGTTEEAQAYRFVDRDLPFAETIRYRLKQIDVDGTFEYSEPVAVQRAPQRFELLPSAPNPFDGAARVRYTLVETAPVTLQVYDLLGRRVTTLVDGEQAAGRYETTLDGSQLAPGTYFVRLRAGTQIQTQRVTVVR